MVTCILSALSPLGGPGGLIDHKDLDIVSAKMASEILSYKQVYLSLEDLTSIISSALELTLPPEDYFLYDRALNFPDGFSDWEYFDCVGIGHFEDQYKGCFIDGRGGVCPSGRDVQVRRINQYDHYGYFYGVIVDDPDAQDGSGVRTEDEASFCGVLNCSFFIMRGCLEYLRAWLDPSLPQRLAFLDSAPSMTLEGELYEIVNSRHEPREHFTGLILSCIQYGDIIKTIDDYANQARFLGARKGSKHTSRAISAELRGTDLLPAIFRDFQCWLSVRPDIWPSPTASPGPTFMAFTDSGSASPFTALPTELLILIFRELPIPALLSLSAVSRSLRALITEPTFLNQTFKAAVMGGSTFWILPVPAIADEEERARRTAMEWLSTTSSDCAALNVESPFHSPLFPYLSFIHACYESNSMRNRERLWNNVKQFDVLWRDYRLHGWQRDVFIH